METIHGHASNFNVIELGFDKFLGWKAEPKFANF